MGVRDYHLIIFLLRRDLKLLLTDPMDFPPVPPPTLFLLFHSTLSRDYNSTRYLSFDKVIALLDCALRFWRWLGYSTFVLPCTPAQIPCQGPSSSNGRMRKRWKIHVTVLNITMHTEWCSGPQFGGDEVVSISRVTQRDGCVALGKLWCKKCRVVARL